MTATVLNVALPTQVPLERSKWPQLAITYKSRICRLFLTILLAHVVAQACAVPSTGDSNDFILAGEEANALLCRPEGKGPFPAVVYSHGQVTNPQMLEKARESGWRGTCKRLGADGFLAFIPIRAFYSDRKPPQVSSNKNELSHGVDHVKSLPEVDPSRVTLMGHSRAGLLTLVVGISSLTETEIKLSLRPSARMESSVMRRRPLRMKSLRIAPPRASSQRRRICPDGHRGPRQGAVLFK